MAAAAAGRQPQQQCSVCCQDFTSVLRKRIECPYCDYDCCAACSQQYLLQTEQDPHCMNCRNGWNRETLDTRGFTKAFLQGAYKKRRQDLLLEREKTLLPASQLVLDNYRMARRLAVEVDESTAILKRRRLELDTLARETYLKKLRLERLRRNNYADAVAANNANDNDDAESVERRTFVRACPVEGCRGFLSTQWRCGTCGTWACSRCHEVKGPDRDTPHECDPDAEATARALARETKPCPGCGMAIYKLGGCDQMWCVGCHTTFSWRTGQRVSGVIHNPHWYEWLRRNGGGEAPRAPGDVPCGGLPSYHSMHATMRRHVSGKVVDDETYGMIMRVHQRATHVQEVVLPRLATRFAATDNADLRLQYLANEIDEAALKTKLQQREKKREKEIAMREIYETFVAVVADSLRAVVHTPTEGGGGDVREAALRACAQTLEIVSFSNQALETVSRRFNVAARLIPV